MFFEWPKRITQVKFIVLFSSRRHGGRTWRLCGPDLHGCAVGSQNRTRRHNAPHAAEQTAAPMCVSDLCHSSTVSPPPAGGIGVRVFPASCVLVPKRDACAFLAQQEKPKTQPASPAAVSYTAYHLAFLHFEFRSRYISRYAGSKFDFLPFVVASIVAMVFLRRICSSRPGDREQRGQSLATLTARGRGLDCFQPQPRQPVLRQNKLRIFRFRASAKAQPLRLFLLSPRSRLLRGDPIYSQTLCVQTDWAA